VICVRNARAPAVCGREASEGSWERREPEKVTLAAATGCTRAVCQIARSERGEAARPMGAIGTLGTLACL
jgi:hypothetical protein